MTIFLIKKYIFYTFLSFQLFFVIYINGHFFFLFPNNYYYFNNAFLILSDGLTFILINLTLLLTTYCLFFVFRFIIFGYYFYFLTLFLIELLILGSFLSLNLFYFYIWFEMLLFPFFFFILFYGSRGRKVHAAYLMFFYTTASTIFIVFSITLFYFFSISLTINSGFYYFSFYKQLKKKSIIPILSGSQEHDLKYNK